jgi:iron complex transport system substrate-binding protein
MSAATQSTVSRTDFPRRIVCLTAETTETLYLLGEQDRIIGVSGFTTRPPEARRKPLVSTFNSADCDAILALEPDLVLTFSDVQAEITRDLVLRGATVLNFNQRSIAEILEMVSTLGKLVGKPTEGEALVRALIRGLDEIALSAKAFPWRPRVFFEEWNEPLISGIRWVEELVLLAGGEPIFPELRPCGKSNDRVVDLSAVLARNPDVIIASWCGMKVKKQEIRSRPGWLAMSAVKRDQIYEIRSSLILQSGPAALTEGVRQIHSILAKLVGVEVDPSLTPAEKADPRFL